MSGPRAGSRPTVASSSRVADAPRVAGAPCVAGTPRLAGKPAWLRVRLPAPAPFRVTARLLDELELHTVCDEARCPNRGECFAAGTATFLILGDTCTRGCGFCAIGRAPARPAAPDGDEPRRVAAAATRLGLRHVVVTSVTRDDLPDGGAGHFAATITALRASLPATTVEVLVPDFAGRAADLRTVLAAGPDVLAHNLETVPRLYRTVRRGASYDRSLALLRRAAAWRDTPTAAVTAQTGGPSGQASSTSARPPLVKTGLMLGLGETADEVGAVLADCAAAGADLVTVGQYLSPRGCLPVARYVAPDEFAALVPSGERLGLHVVAGPFVRSSYRAGEALASILTTRT